MSMRLLVLALVLHATCAAAESIHLAPLGTVVSGSFDLAGKSIPLPAGNFVLAATTVTETGPGFDGSISNPRPKVARVLLVQIEPPRLRAAVMARAVLKTESYRYTWAGNPCKKEDTLYRADLARSVGEESENCLLVDHVIGAFNPRSQGIWKDAAAWLGEQQVQLPVPVLIMANVSRTERWQLVAASYAFNPRMYGCDAPRSRSWADSPWNKKSIDGDPQRVRFVESVVGYGKAMQQHFDALVAGRQSTIEKAPSIYSCAAAQAALN